MDRDKKEAIRRGRSAQALLENQDLRDAWAAVEERISRDLFGSQPADAELREQLYYEYHALKRVGSELIATIRRGKQAEESSEDNLKVV